MQFEWNQQKASDNFRKHKIAFEEAMLVFTDPLARIFPDEGHSDTEDRELIIGHDGLSRLLIVSFVERHGVIRMISARQTTSREKSDYEKGTK